MELGSNFGNRRKQLYFLLRPGWQRIKYEVHSRRGSPESAAGAIAQLGERLNGIQEVGGSIPPGSTKSSHAYT